MQLILTVQLYRYYQPTIEINQEACFPSNSPTPPVEGPSLENGSPPQFQVNADIASSKISSPDTALTAFCQLVTWRTGAQRALIRLEMEILSLCSLTNRAALLIQIHNTSLPKAPRL